MASLYAFCKGERGSYFTFELLRYTLISVVVCLCFINSSYQSATFFEEIKQLYYVDEFSSNVQDWNKERSGAIEMALNNILYPQLAKELKEKLIKEAKEGIIKVIQSQLQTICDPASQNQQNVA